MSEDSVKKIINIFKDAALDFKDKFNKNLVYYFAESISEEEIILKFNVEFDRKLEYLMIMKKQKNNSNSIPKLRGYESLSNDGNPFKKLKYTDENYILGRIYDFIIENSFDEIVCYLNFGILIRNPLDLKGIYNINVKFVGD